MSLTKNANYVVILILLLSLHAYCIQHCPSEQTPSSLALCKGVRQLFFYLPSVMHAWLCLLQLETFEAINNSLVGTLPTSWSNLGDHRVSAAVLYATQQTVICQSDIKAKLPV